MSLEGIIKSFDLGDGRTISIETGRLARQADGSAVVKMGDTMLLATVVANKEPVVGSDFMPLSVEYREKYSATGRFPGGFIKREARPSDHEILIARLVDRALRPLFPDDFHAETQVIITLISGDKNLPPDSLAALAASSALTLSDIPFRGPISEVRIARINGEFIINPLISQLEEADLDLVVAATLDNIVMVEGEMKEVHESTMIEALKAAHDAIRVQCRAQLELAEMLGRPVVKREYCHETNDPELLEALRNATYQKTYDTAISIISGKHERTEAFEAIKNEFIETIPEEFREVKVPLVEKYFHE
ncbi:MAG: polyribonucleotide nucleotidyltransferase, partial [Bacteroidales bacterium]|nr:polyribonucleotide nucleotidyltransferase [Bacteroidales bacterium]